MVQNVYGKMAIGNTTQMLVSGVVSSLQGCMPKRYCLNCTTVDCFFSYKQHHTGQSCLDLVMKEKL